MPLWAEKWRDVPTSDQSQGIDCLFLVVLQEMSQRRSLSRFSAWIVCPYLEWKFSKGSQDWLSMEPRRISLNYFRSLIVCLVFSSLLLPTAGKTFPFLLAQQWRRDRRMEIPFVTMLGFQRAHKKGRREENVLVPVSCLFSWQSSRKWVTSCRSSAPGTIHSVLSFSRCSGRPLARNCRRTLLTQLTDRF